MYVMNKKRNEIVEIGISGRAFVKGNSVYSGKADEKPSYQIGRAHV